MRYDARRWRKLARSASAHCFRRARESPRRRAHIVERFTKRFGAQTSESRKQAAQAVKAKKVPVAAK